MVLKLKVDTEMKFALKHRKKSKKHYWWIKDHEIWGENWIHSKSTQDEVKQITKKYIFCPQKKFHVRKCRKQNFLLL